MAEALNGDSGMERPDMRQLTARLAAAIMIADGRITESEVVALGRLRGLGLGALEPRVQVEIERAMREPIDLVGTIAALGSVAPQSAALLVSGLTHIAASDRDLSPRELQVLTAVGEGLGLSAAQTGDLIRDAIELDTGAPAPAPAPDARQTAPAAAAAAKAAPTPASAAAGGAPADWAFRLLGLAPNSSLELAEAAYAALVRRYNPAAVLELGPEFAVLAVQRLSNATAAFIAVRDRLAPR